MKNLIPPFKFLILTYLLTTSLYAGEITNFEIDDTNGVKFSLFSQSKAKAIVLIAHSIGCPIVRQTYQRYKDVAKAYKKDNIEFWYVNSNPQDNTASLLEEIKSYNVNIPILLDHKQTALKILELKITTETVVINPANWSIVYRGAIDDQVNYGGKKKKAAANYLTNALDDVVSNKEVRLKKTRPFGCHISLI